MGQYYHRFYVVLIAGLLDRRQAVFAQPKFKTPWLIFYAGGFFVGPVNFIWQPDHGGSFFNNRRPPLWLAYRFYAAILSANGCTRNDSALFSTLTGYR